MPDKELKREVLFSQIASSLGFPINAKQAELLIEVISLIDLKGDSINFKDIQDLSAKYIK